MIFQKSCKTLHFFQWKRAWARALDSLSRPWVRIGGVSFLTTVPQFWPEKSRPWKKPYKTKHFFSKSIFSSKKVSILLRRRMTFGRSRRFVSTGSWFLSLIFERLASTKCIVFFLHFVEAPWGVKARIFDSFMKMTPFSTVAGRTTRTTTMEKISVFALGV